MNDMEKNDRRCSEKNGWNAFEQKKNKMFDLRMNFNLKANRRNFSQTHPAGGVKKTLKRGPVIIIKSITKISSPFYVGAGNYGAKLFQACDGFFFGAVRRLECSSAGQQKSRKKIGRFKSINGIAQFRRKSLLAVGGAVKSIEMDWTIRTVTKQRKLNQTSANGSQRKSFKLIKILRRYRFS